jgi:hypothetical protein
MEPTSYMRSVVDRNVVMRRIPVYDIVIHLHRVITITYLKKKTVCLGSQFMAHVMIFPKSNRSYLYIRASRSTSSVPNTAVLSISSMYVAQVFSEWFGDGFSSHNTSSTIQIVTSFFHCPSQSVFYSIFLGKLWFWWLSVLQELSSALGVFGFPLVQIDCYY